MSNFYYPEHKTLFIHIPKTGGSSIRRGILLKKKVLTSFGEFEDPFEFSFAFVRNPYDRLASAYYMFARKHTLNALMDIIENDSIGLSPKGGLARVKHHIIPMTDPYNGITKAQFIGRFENYKEDLKTAMDGMKIKMPKEVPHIMANKHKTAPKNYRDIYDCQTQGRVSKIFENDLDTFKYIF